MPKKITVELSNGDLASLDTLRDALNARHRSLVGELMHRDLTSADVAIIAIRAMAAEQAKKQESEAG